MGLMTLADFRTDLQGSIGDRDFTDAQLDRWINYAYLDIGGAVNFDEMNILQVIATVDGTASYSLPARTRMVKFVAMSSVPQGLLQYMDPTDYFRRDRSGEGTPLRWTRYANSIFIHPTPSAIFGLSAAIKQDPLLLSASGDMTVLAPIWDVAIHLLGIYHGLLSIGQEARAQQWFARGVNYIQSRATQDELFIREPGLGLTYTIPQTKLIAALTESQAASGAR